MTLKKTQLIDDGASIMSFDTCSTALDTIYTPSETGSTATLIQLDPQEADETSEDSDDDEDFKDSKSKDVFVEDDPSVTIHSIDSRDGVIVSVHPPKQPKDLSPAHKPCDIVLVIDVSGSMDMRAPAPMYDDAGNSIREDFGLSILDITKHAARTILETLDEGDRLGIVTFSRCATVVQELIPMTKSNKKDGMKRINDMEPDSCTNLWHGILKGLELFEGKQDSGRVPALMVLTDGQPNSQ
ncbi:hypothetical protein F4780DRAFT_736416 [Xylariomycetidae sp. FL0641]|nr:hypothetical protein F4780DRAFT_736416 [Xylariomycetidae sp. FL0641]